MKSNNVLLTTTEAAQILRVKPNTLEVWRSQGRSPKFLKINGAVRYRATDLDDFIVASIRGGNEQPAAAGPGLS